MEFFYTKNDLKKYINTCRDKHLSIGFVPTMGALHAGHTSLIDKAKEYSDRTIVSIFVNPKQFNNQEDLANYPSTAEQDIELLKQHGCDAVFIPSSKEIYGQKDYEPYKIDLGNLGQILEAEKRPGHFDGVVEILYILFQLVQPDYTFFGLKDYQQVLVVEKLLESMNSNIQLIKCETVRRKGGLALSSRNKRLNTKEKKIAVNLYKTLSAFKEKFGKLEPSTLKKSYLNKINSLENTKVDYLEIVDSQTLKPLNSWNPKGKNLGILAVYIGNVRLIDNLLF